MTEATAISLATHPEDFRVEVVADRPERGMWHTGPNPSWVTVIHLPTQISARMYGHSQHKARQAAAACVEMMLSECRFDKCSFPERL